MIVGILSDTHGKLPATRAALQTLAAAGAEFYVHCGDVGGQGVFDLLAGLPAAFVWGNNDYDREELRDYAARLGVACHEDFADLDLGGRRVAVTHGDNPKIIRQVVAGRRHQYLLHGHTHVARDETLNGLRFVNPGALHRTPRPSVAVLDTERDAVRFIAVNVPRT